MHVNGDMGFVEGLLWLGWDLFVLLTTVFLLLLHGWVLDGL